MRAFVCAWHRAERGGLHMHVRAQVKTLRAAGHECVVMCPPGWLSHTLRLDGVTVLEDDFRHRAVAVSRARAAGPFDLVHAHPFASLETGLAVAAALDVPAVLTVHGMSLDNLAGHAQHLDRVVVVCPAIEDHVGTAIPALLGRIRLVPNGIDPQLFCRRTGPDDIADRLHVLVVGRLDRDRRRALAEVEVAWNGLPSVGVRWSVVGDGELRPSLNEAVGEHEVAFLGWRDQDELASLYRSADVVVASGRSAMEAVASGIPVVATGIRVHIGPVDEDTLHVARHTNFGDAGPAFAVTGVLAEDIDRARIPSVTRRSLAEAVVAEFDEGRVGTRLLAVYDELVGTISPASSSS